MTHDNTNGEQATVNPKPPLRAPLPDPPFVTLGGVEYLLERVRIEDLDNWRREHDSVRVRTAFLGRPGWRPTVDGKMRFSGLGHVTIHWPKSWMEEATP